MQFVSLRLNISFFPHLLFPPHSSFPLSFLPLSVREANSLSPHPFSLPLTSSFPTFSFLPLSSYDPPSSASFGNLICTESYISANVDIFCGSNVLYNYFFTFVMELTLYLETMKITRIAIFLFVLCSVVSLQGANIDTLKVHSASMNKEIPVIVISPETTDQSARFPVIYLLHGHGGDEYNWIHVKPELPQMADRDGIIVVCPDGENSWYWDSPINPAMRYETFVSQELPDYVDQHYPTIADRTGRAITGLSMGGHGAMWISIRHSDRFGASGATSGGVDIRPLTGTWPMHSENWRTIGKYGKTIR